MNTLFHILFTATWQSMVLAAFVLLLVFLLRERLAPRFRYLLWCVVLLCLALPILPVSPWGVLPNQSYVKQNHAEQSRNREIAVVPVPVSPIVVVPQAQSYDCGSVNDTIIPVTETSVTAVDYRAIILAIWLLGAIVFGIRYVLEALQVPSKFRQI